jgi:hypothetical protein
LSNHEQLFSPSQQALHPCSDTLVNMRNNKKFLFFALFISILIITSHCATVKKDLVITWEQDAPNGQTRYMIKTNGQYPGPSLIFNEDDDVEVSHDHFLKDVIS